MFGTRIVIADTDTAFRRTLKEAFRHADYQLVGEASDARGALQVIFQSEPHVVIMDPYLPGGEGIELTSIIDDHRVAPVVAVVTHSQDEIEDYARLPGVYGVLMKPLQGVPIQPVVESALANFERAVRMEKELKDLRHQLENRKIIEMAKGLLMEKKKMAEKEAYKHMQKLSMDKCMPLARVARSVILHYQHRED